MIAAGESHDVMMIVLKIIAFFITIINHADVEKP